MRATPPTPAPKWQTSRERWARSTSPRQSPFALQAAIAIVGLFLLLPLAYLLIRAADAGPRAFDLLLRPRTLIVVGNSIALTLTATGLTMLIAIPLAWLTVRTDLPGRKWWSVLTVLPLVVPSYVGGFALVAMFGPRGMLQEWLAPLGVDRLPEIFGFPGAVLALTLFTYPYLLLSVRAGLARLDPSLEEAARSLGHNARQTFWRVTLPSLRPFIATGALLVALYVLSDFGAVSLLRFNSITRVIYLQYQSSFDRSLAAILSLILVIMTLILLLGEQITRGRARYYRSGTGVSRRPAIVQLGRWKWPALAFCTSIVLIALVVPVAVIVIWFVRGLIGEQSFLPMWLATWNSLRAASLSAVLAVMVAVPIAYLALRFNSRIGAFADRSAYVGHGLPGIVVALSLVFFGANYASALYQTLPMLLFAYLVLFLSQALGAIRGNFMQISPRLEEAARSLGDNTWRMHRRVTLPLLRPGLAAGAALVFLTTIKELPATLLLAPTGFTTLSMQIWSATESAFFARAAAPALLLLGLSALSIFIILRQEETTGP